MLYANQLAEKGLGRTFPNPIVGAVVVNAAGQVISEGFHERSGGNHAEVNALAGAGNQAKGSTLIVTLEPCQHYGKTPPCTEAIINSGISTVVYGSSDPHLIAGGGGAKLLEAGLEVFAGIESDVTDESNRGWLKKIQRGIPLITIKIASTFDGRITASDGSSKWITGEISRNDVGTLRSRSDVLISTTETVLRDNPRLTSRNLGGNEMTNPLRVIVGTRDIPKTFQIHNSEAETIFLKTRSIREILDFLIDSGFNSVLVEAGSTFHTALLKEDVVDEVVIYQSASFLGSGKSSIQNLGIENVEKRMNFSIKSSEIFGDDIKTHLIRKRVS